MSEILQLCLFFAICTEKKISDIKKTQCMWLFQKQSIQGARNEFSRTREFPNVPLDNASSKEN